MTQLSAGFTMPAAAADVTISVGDSSWMSPTQVVYVQTAGYFEVQSLPDSTSAIIRNLGYSGNASAGTAIANGQGVSPGGLIGATGATGASSLSGASGISPTTTKGDIIVDNGSNSPSPSTVRVAVGTNGQILAADSGAAAGVAWKSTIPISGVVDDSVPRFDGTSGTPTPMQASYLVVTDDGAVQCSGSGGDARGQYATDLQVDRANSTEVASGTNSVICGGENNTASNDRAVVVGGLSNVASGVNSFVGGGDNNTASGTNATICGGDNHVASATYTTIGGGTDNEATTDGATIGGGSSNVSSGSYSVISGGFSNLSEATQSTVGGGSGNEITSTGNYATIPGGRFAVADKHGQMAHAPGKFSVEGDVQTSELILWNQTTNATPTNLLLDASAARATIASGYSWTLQGLVVGRRSNGDTAHWKFEGGIHNNAGTTSLTAAITATLIAADAGCSGTWGVAGSVAVTADDANDCLQVQVTGTAANTIRWVCWLRIVEVNH